MVTRQEIQLFQKDSLDVDFKNLLCVFHIDWSPNTLPTFSNSSDKLKAQENINQSNLVVRHLSGLVKVSLSLTLSQPDRSMNESGHFAENTSVFFIAPYISSLSQTTILLLALLLLVIVSTDQSVGSRVFW